MTSWRGVFAVLTTPFDDEGALDPAAIAAQAEFCVAAGAHGVVTPVNASEYWTLSDAERRTVAQVTIEAIDGRVPVVVGVTTGSASSTANLARHAQSVGADALMAMPPSGNSSIPAKAVWEYYRTLSACGDLPIFVQNYHTPASAQMAPDFVAKLVRELEHVDYIKEEAWGANRSIQREIELAGPKLRGVMGGLAGRYMLEEYRRGACGTMPACEVVDVHVQVWEALDTGDDRKARNLFNRLLPLLNFEALTPGVYKNVLKRRGVLPSNYMRTHGGSPLDALEEQELDQILDDLRDLFVVT